MTVRPVTARFYEQDHPALANTLIGKLRTEERNYANQVASGLAADWPDYKARVGYLQGLRDAIALCEEVQKTLTGG